MRDGLLLADHFLIEALPFLAPVVVIVLVLGVLMLRDRREGERG